MASNTSRRSLSGNNFEIADACERETLLNDDSDQDEDTIFNKPRTSNETVQVHGKLDSVRLQIHEVTNVMRDNVQKVMERGERLEDLQLASDRLTMAGTEFRNSARKARYEGWLRNLIAKFGFIAGVLTIVVIIIVALIVKYS